MRANVAFVSALVASFAMIHQCGARKMQQPMKMDGTVFGVLLACIANSVEPVTSQVPAWLRHRPQYQEKRGATVTPKYDDKKQKVTRFVLKKDNLELSMDCETVLATAWCAGFDVNDKKSYYYDGTKKHYFFVFGVSNCLGKKICRYTKKEVMAGWKYGWTFDVHYHNFLWRAGDRRWKYRVNFPKATYKKEVEEGTCWGYTTSDKVVIQFVSLTVKKPGTGKRTYAQADCRRVKELSDYQQRKTADCKWSGAGVYYHDWDTNGKGTYSTSFDATVTDKTCEMAKMCRSGYHFIKSPESKGLKEFTVYWNNNKKSRLFYTFFEGGC